MINANLEDFLISGWYNYDATLYLNGYTYWCEGVIDPENNRKFHFWVYRYRSIIHRKENGEIWTSRMIKDHDVVDYSTVLDVWGDSPDDVKPIFLSAKIFDGKSFWEVEKEIAWYDEY